jgi:truncated hemoglobin YjbI
LGFDIEAILSDKETPLVQHLIEGGISYEVQLAWLKNLKEALASVMNENLGTIHTIFTMAAPVL